MAPPLQASTWRPVQTRVATSSFAERALGGAGSSVQRPEEGSNEAAWPGGPVTPVGKPTLSSRTTSADPVQTEGQVLAWNGKAFQVPDAGS